ncbi:unnamed protein product [Gongylonema pulchrum]|uniref:BAR domain-containing protein n=1 Tax=Gongylonema pulchrum TaxID=637853 RepID=A0A183CUF8_9BILA|nr:unnamed protein product [Gongylonema pulchrum]
MTAKVKAAAYRLTGGSKTVYSAEYESKVALFHTFRNQTEKLISQLTKLVTDNMATEVMQKLSKDNAEMGMNKFERVGEALHKYGTQLDDDHSAEVLEKAKDVFEKMGQEHRSLRTNIIEKVQKPLKEWIDTDAKDTGKELKTLESRRDELDCAINKLRKKQDDADCQVSTHQLERLDFAHFCAQLILMRNFFVKMEEPCRQCALTACSKT